MARSDMRSYSADDLRRMKAAGKTATRPDAPAYAVPGDFWDGAEIRQPEKPNKAHISLRVDQDVLEWFRTQEGPYLTRINAVLRSYMERVGKAAAPAKPRSTKVPTAKTSALAGKVLREPKAAAKRPQTAASQKKRAG